MTRSKCRHANQSVPLTDFLMSEAPLFLGCSCFFSCGVIALSTSWLYVLSPSQDLRDDRAHVPPCPLVLMLPLLEPGILDAHGPVRVRWLLRTRRTPVNTWRPLVLSWGRRGRAFCRARASLSRLRKCTGSPSSMFCPLGGHIRPKLRNGGFLLLPPQGGGGSSQAGGRAAALEAELQHLVGRVGAPHEAGLPVEPLKQPRKASASPVTRVRGLRVFPMLTDARALSSPARHPAGRTSCCRAAAVGGRVRGGGRSGGRGGCGVWLLAGSGYRLGW